MVMNQLQSNCEETPTRFLGFLGPLQMKRSNLLTVKWLRTVPRHSIKIQEWEKELRACRRGRRHGGPTLALPTSKFFMKNLRKILSLAVLSLLFLVNLFFMSINP